MSDADLAKLDRDALVALTLQQAATIAMLQARLDELTCAGKRQAPPFSKGTRKAKPKTLGRKPGEGLFRRRMAPPLEALAEASVPVTEPACPGCCGDLAFDRVEDASITDLPPVPRPQVRLFEVDVHCCFACGDTARSHHPDLAADQHGAPAHRFGPRLMAAAHNLRYRLGVPVRKLPEVLQLLTGVTITQGAITLDALHQDGVWDAGVRGVDQRAGDVLADGLGAALLDAIVALVRPTARLKRHSSL